MDFKKAKITMLDLDLKGCLYLNHFSHSQAVAYFFKMISRFGNGLFWLIMLASLWMLEGVFYLVQLVYLLLSGSVGTLIYKILKQKTVRPRPYQVHQVIRMQEQPLDHFSFPSGHTLHAVMASAVLGHIQPMLLILMLPFTILVAISRMVLGLHYPSDVVVGALIGAVVASGIIVSAPFFNIML
ncbi:MULTISPECIES: phosphatase PAP2 family protein [unclassified Acinetobacter]|uniref:phosphatase PAP2 family protein n=1 Tax=unclassified Acinetobacter TaxID=196816 RepID=UPI000A32DD17|nr:MULTISPECIES: phosphatase PAP2 family protein [unclassified Acinetobacter]MCG2609229.1 phosphatase PAP2 family protein [Acinetobacter sp. SM34]MDN5510757.1 phosphatase PAP2 family protein [Acinetobacter sp.]MDN5526067.1 phosphatase PAP2 family protein [Acinetobacter sp.]OTG61837.1 phosphatidylglycerophosphatase [Acinetobacter sp. ANC 3903]